MKIYSKLLFLFIIFMIIYGLYFVSKPRRFNESFVGTECPTTMIKDGQRILLYNPNLAKVPGVNPIQLNSLEDYEEYVHWQRANKINCPILHLEKVFDTQGSEMYQISSSFDTENCNGGLNHNLPAIKPIDSGHIIDAALENPPYNANQFPSYDKDNQDIGRQNTIDSYTFNYYNSQL